MPDYSQHPLNKSYDLDTALSSLWEFYKKWFGSLFVISFVFSLVTTYLSGRVDIAEIYSMSDTGEMMDALGSVLGPYALIYLFTFTFTLVLQYFVIVKPLDPENSVFTIGIEGIKKYFLPLLALYIILAVFAVIAIMLGLFVFVVGALFAAIYIVMIAAFISPVLMIEEPGGIGDTINTSIRLAHKRLWPNIGWVAIFVILLLVISFILSALVMIPYGGSFLKSISNPGNSGEVMNLANKPSFIILSSLANAVTMPLFPVFSLVLYFNARSAGGRSSYNNKPDSTEGGGRVKIEDLYADPGKDKKKENRKKADPPPPSVDDLRPLSSEKNNNI